MATTPITMLAIVNRVLIRLRESEVASFDDTEYAKLVLQLVNDAKREVEDAFNWDSIKKTVTVNNVASTSALSVTDGVGSDTTARTRIVEIYNNTTDNYLTMTTREHIRRMAYDDTTEQEPTYFSMDGIDANQNVQIQLHPIPDGVYDLKITCYSPQEDLTGETDQLIVPWHPVYLRALTLALRERGDDEGYSFGEAFQEYMVALNDAIAYEQRQKFVDTGEGDWHIISNGF